MNQYNIEYMHGDHFSNWQYIKQVTVSISSGELTHINIKNIFQIPVTQRINLIFTELYFLQHS